MAAFEVQTTEVHLLLSSASILYANTFQLKVLRSSDRKDVTGDTGTDYTIDAVTTATVSAGGLITAVAAGQTFLHVSYSEGDDTHNLVIKVQVHSDIAKSSGKYLIYCGDERITTYKSRTTGNILNVYYIPTIYAKFTDNTFGDISRHPFLIYQETAIGGGAAGSALLNIERTLISGTLYNYSGRFRCVEKGTDTTVMQLHREIKVILHESTSSGTSKKVGIRCEDFLDTPKPILTKLPGKSAKKEEPVTRVLILGEGYDKDNNNFEGHCSQLIQSMKKIPPYDLLEDSMEFWYAAQPSGESGVTIPSYLNVEDVATDANILIPAGLNYFKFSKAVKAAISDVGIYDGTAASETKANTFYTSHTSGVTSGIPQADFIASWKKSRINGFMKNKDTRFCLTLGGPRLSEAVATQGETATGNSFWVKGTDYYNIGYDRRKTYIETSASGNGSGNTFLNVYLNSLTAKDPSETLTGQTWLGLNENMYRRTYIAILVNHPLRMGVNTGLFFATTLGENSTLDLSGPDNNVAYEDGGTVKATLPDAKVATFIHEMSHFFNIGDEYEDGRGEGHENFTPDVGGYSGLIEYANVDSFNNLKVSDLLPDISPFKVKWNWTRIGLSSAVLQKPVINAHKLELQLASKAETDKWQKVKTDGERVYIRTLHFPDVNGKIEQYDFSVLGEHETGPLTVDTINDTTFKVILSIDQTAGQNYEVRIQTRLEDKFKNEACLFTKRKGIYRLDKVIPKPGSTVVPNFIRPDKKEYLTREIQLKSTSIIGKNAPYIELKVKKDGGFEIKLLKDGRKYEKGVTAIFLSDDPIKVDLPAGWFDGTPIQPELSFEFEPYNTSLDKINVINPGGGYTGTVPPSVTITPANGAVATAVLGGNQAFVKLKPDKTGGEFLSQVYLEAIDLRTNINGNKKGKGLKALVTELSADGGILDYKVIDLGNGMYSTNSTQTKIIVTTNGKEYDKASNKATFTLDYEAYMSLKKGEGYKFESLNGGAQWKMRIPIKIDTAGQDYKIPIGPLVFSLGTSYPGSPALILGYLDNDKKIDRIEILLAGENFTPGQVLTVVEGIKDKEYADYYTLNGLWLPDYRKTKKIYDNPPAGEGISVVKDDAWPVFQVLTTGTGGAITSMGFFKKDNVEQRGVNLRYPTLPLSLIASDEGSYSDFKKKEMGEYEIEFKPSTGTGADLNSRLIDKVVLKTPNMTYTANRKIRLYGGKAEIPTRPSGTPSGTDSYSVPCDIAANAGGAEVELIQGQSVKEIIFNKVGTTEQRGTGFLNRPVITISPPQIPEGVTAQAEADLSLFPRLVDPSILKKMSELKKPLIDKFTVPNLPTGEPDKVGYIAAGHQKIMQMIKDINIGKAIEDIIIDENISPDMLIAIYEGGATYDNKSYRPSFDSLMRNSYRYEDSKTFGFNFVTMYYLINFLNPSKLGELDRKEYFKSIKYTVKLS